ncbi:MAG: hypothetical protein ACR5K4_01265 [Sodalis sp. (in: enterobacteria)]
MNYAHPEALYWNKTINRLDLNSSLKLHIELIKNHLWLKSDRCLRCGEIIAIDD